MRNEIIKRVYPYLKLLAKYKVSFGLGLLCGIFNGALSGAGLPLMVDKVLPLVFSDPPPDLPVLIAAIAALPVLLLLRGVTNYFNVYLMNFCGVRVLMGIRERIQEKLQSLPLAFYNRNNNGDLLSRALNDTTHLQATLVDIASDVIKQPVTLIGAVVALVYLSIQEKQIIFLLLLIGIIPAMVVPLRYVGKRLLKRHSELQEITGELSQVVSENISAAREVRAFNLERIEEGRFSKILERFCKIKMKTVKYDNIMRPFIEFAGAVGAAIAITYFVQSDIETGKVIALFVAFWVTYEPMKKLGDIYNKFKRGQAFLERIEYVTEEEDTLLDPEDPLPMGEVQGAIDLKNVSFRYLEEWVLRDMNVQIAAGETVALVGPSGAGKSTMADLIPRFYDVDEGAIEIDGKDVRSVKKHDLRSVISVVSQDTFLFNMTIRENIRLGRPDATDEEIESAARDAFAHDFILAMEEGYDTVVGDRGTRLSGGQKQRIAIARAFLKAAPILILDEATSALDSESEEMIQRSIERLVEGRTVIVIAHRFSTIRAADTIVVLEAGKMIGHGTHDELYATNATYKKLYDRQFSE